MRKVEIMPYDEAWPEKYLEASEEIKTVLGQELLYLYHIGSTSIPGMAAKPIIDILAEVQDIQRIDDYNNEMVKQGYTPKGENGIEGRRYFVKGNDEERTHHVHIFETGSKEIIKHLAFREYLTYHEQDMERYKKVKEDLAEKYPENVKLYQEEKASLIDELNQKALDWVKGR
ncbi:GrpB family protein [Gracilibacillus sp. YIM 98692]|uniref:GrpB family protein n=1 Tax=Gracilibacillus sp. YIM 98692 TaxID=2663532 RepID=UPI0013CF6538|nr:GrpB family protein [Gracilibacillus sp. YIM 98692]